MKPRFTTLAAALALAASAHATIFFATLDGPSESPPNASPGTGTATVTYDPIGHTLRVETSFSGLLGTTTAAHIHAPTTVAGAGTAGVAFTPVTLPGFPSGVTAASYDSGPVDLTVAASYHATFLALNGGTPAGAEAGLIAAMLAGKAYLNIHTSAVTSGEIRGFLAVPEPGTWALVAGLGLVSFGTVRRLRRG